MKKWVIILISAGWFPHSLEKVTRLGYDWGIYYRAGQGNFGGGWYYNDMVGWLFRPFTWFTEGFSFVLWYILLVWSWVGLQRKLDTCGVGVLGSILVAYSMLLCLEVGQIAPILAWACLTPLGAVCSMLVKPYMFMFVLIHAALYWYRAGGKKGLIKAESDVLTCSIRNI